MLLKPPPDGLEGAPDVGALIARMPVYGTRDAGRDHGPQGNRIMPAVFSIHNDKTEITCIVGTHVDDILWAADDRSQKIIGSAFAEFDTREIKAANFRYCGLEVAQAEDFAA
eukprot:3946787-Pyramimonas_sp.AAC.1